LSTLSIRSEPTTAILRLTLLALVALLPWFGSKYAIDLTARTMIMAVFAMGLQLLVGEVGLVSLGQAAYFGIAGYVVAMVSPPDTPAQLLLVLPMSIAAASAYAWLVGVLSLRARGIYFIMVTLAFAQLCYTLAHDTALVGGSDGAYINVRPVIALFGRTLMDLNHRTVLYYVIAGGLLLTYVGLQRLRQTRFGRALAGINNNEARMRAAGYETRGFKLAAFVLAGALCGLAGFLNAVKDGYVNPETLSWHQSGLVLLMVILGGASSPRGAIAGAAGLTLLEELFRSDTLFGPLALHWQLLMGLAVIGLVALLPRGLIGAFTANARGAPRPVPPTTR
jgi:branched-chain amino acid transport system permease protein